MLLAPRNASEAGESTLIAFKPVAAGAAQHDPASNRPRPATAALFVFRPRHQGAGPASYGRSNHPATAAISQPARPAAVAMSRALTATDRMELLSWHCSGGQGYARLMLETGITGGAPDLGGYALLYPVNASWATLGITRTSDGILVWRCATGVAHGVFPNMSAALRAVPLAKTATNRV